jgi:hypothetical protein
MKPVAPWTQLEIRSGLPDRCFIDIDGIDPGIRFLRQHQRDHPAAGADLKDGSYAAGFRPCSQKDGIGTDPHCAAVIIHDKLLKTEGHGMS